MEKRELVYQGKAKKLYTTTEDEVLWVEYLDQVTALNGVKKDVVSGKGALNNQITSRLFERLDQEGIASHFIRQVSLHEQLVHKVSMIPLEVVVRNVAAGSFSKRLGIEEGTALPTPIVEFYYKNDGLDDPFINEDHIRYLDISNEEDINVLKTLALKINDILTAVFRKIAIQLIDFKLEFGCLTSGEIILADEISPDTCRLWDVSSHAHLDKDVYRRELGDIVMVYQEVLSRLEKEPTNV